MKQKPILSESTVRKFMKFANLGKVGEAFISEAYGHEEEEDEDEGKLDPQVADMKGMKKEFPHKKGAAARNVTGPKVHEGAEEEEDEGDLEEAVDIYKGFKDQKMSAAKAPKKHKMNEEEMMGEPEMGAEMPETPEVLPAEEPTEMDASSLADQIIQVLQGAGLVDVVEGDEEEHHAEEEDEGMPEEEGDEEEDEEEDEDLMEAKKRQVAKIVAERVMKRLQREQKVDRLAETITKKVMARMAGK